MSYSPLTTAELDRYFARIAYQGSPRADIGTLAALHYLHPLAIPFENLDSWSGHTPLLDEAAVFTKLVDAGRGGYCFEHNQLFLRALLALGFNVQTLAARVIQPGQPLPRTHKVLLIQNDAGITFGKPFVEGGKVTATIRSHGRHKKVHIIKFRRRKHYMKKQGHRQNYTEIEITGISG